ncbi:MAG: hypothetical protein JJT85_12035 [Chromatiales bacterium]|nr:hypothetical protein [Chromatiales bacterium]
MSRIADHHPRRHSRLLAAPAVSLLVAACAAQPASDRVIGSVPLPLEQFCLEAQQVVINTRHPFLVELHRDTEAFIRSKAEIDPPRVHQFIWYEDEAQTLPAMVSCKLKSADHLNLVFGEGTAGPPGTCQDMNRLTLERALAARGGAAPPVRLEPARTMLDDDEPGMSGPLWLLPHALATRDEAGTLVIDARGFLVEFLDPRFLEAPPPFRGVQYCHFIAPGYLKRLLDGEVEPGQYFGIDITDRPPP